MVCRPLRSGQTQGYDPRAMRPRRPRTPKAPPPPAPDPEPGDRVRVREIPGEQSAPAGVPGRYGTVLRAHGRSVVVEMDEPFSVLGGSQRIYYSYAGELEVVPRVGRLGAVDLFADDEAGADPDAA